MVVQILWGSLILGICTIIHVLIILGWVKTLRNHFKVSLNETTHGTLIILLIFGLLMIVLVHTVQVWLWAGALLFIGAVSSFSDAIYFSLVTYTTVGYGDFTLEAEHRIFGAMAAVTGLLSFGISTAFLVGLLSRFFPEKLN